MRRNFVEMLLSSKTAAVAATPHSSKVLNTLNTASSNNIQGLSSKLVEAEKLAFRPADTVNLTEEECRIIRKNLDDSISIYEKLCTLRPAPVSLSPSDRLKVVVSFLKHHPSAGLDAVYRYRDALPFYSGKFFSELVYVIKELASVSVDILSSHERMVCAMCLYNNAVLADCYEAFTAIANDVNVSIDYRVDACRYLFGSGDTQKMELAQEHLQTITNSSAYTCEYRYGVIASFITRKGINSMMNKGKIRVPYDEEFVCGLQTTFFNNSANGVRERILSGQSLLGMSEGVLDVQDREEVMVRLLEIAVNPQHTDNTRADAADVLLRLGTTKYVAEAKNVITDLGGHALATGSTLLQRIRTIYNDSQNVHNDSIAASVNVFLEKILHDPNHTSGIVPSFLDVYNDVARLIRVKLSTPQEKFSANRGLNRITIDTAVFTKYKITVADVFVHVWICILSHPEQEREELQKRLLQELIEADDTCSSGHAARYVNVLSAYDVDLRITWADQIRANIIGRLEARIRDHPNNETKQSIALGAMADADPEDRQVYVSFITATLDDLHSELKQEFVGDGYIKEEEFEKYFNDGKKAVTPSEKKV